MFEYLLKSNDLEPVMKRYDLIPEEDTCFITELIIGPPASPLKASAVSLCTTSFEVTHAFHLVFS